MKNTKKELMIYYQGKSIGKIINPKIDHFDLYGIWMPERGVVYSQFVASIENGELVEVQIGEDDPSLKGTVEIEPEEEIEIKIRMEGKS